MNKYIITIIVALMALGIGAKAQTVYSCQYKSEADVKGLMCKTLCLRS